MVIAIIAVLMSMLMPSLGQAKKMAQRTACSVNHRSIGLAGALYRQDNNDVIPISVTAGSVSSFTAPSGTRVQKTWRQMLYEYDKGGGFRWFDCPASQHPVRTEGDVDNQNVGSIGVMCLHSYAFQSGIYRRVANDYWCDGAYPVRNYFIDEFWPVENGMGWHSPQDSMYAADAYEVYGTPFRYPSVEASFGTNAIHWITSVPAPGTVIWDRRSFADRHFGTNVLFFDGSVRLYRAQDLDRMVPGAPDNIWDVW